MSSAGRRRTSPRCAVSRKPLPMRDFAAVAPSRTTTSGLYGVEFGQQPGPATPPRSGWASCGCGACLALLELEVLDRVGDVDVASRSMSAATSALSSNRPAGPDERLSRLVFLVARLLADQHDGACDPLAENRLRGVAVQIAALAFLRCVGQNGQVVGVGHEFSGARRCHTDWVTHPVARVTSTATR